MSTCPHCATDVTCPNCAWRIGDYQYWPKEALRPHKPGALPVPQLTEADVRRIVREELARTPPQSHGEKQT